MADAILLVVEPTPRSLGPAVQIKKLANDTGLTGLFLVGNQVRNDDEAAFLKTELPGPPMLDFLPADLKVQEADWLGIPVFDHDPELKRSFIILLILVFPLILIKFLRGISFLLPSCNSCS